MYLFLSRLDTIILRRTPQNKDIKGKKGREHVNSAITFPVPYTLTNYTETSNS